jgi:hypothetical protein
MGFGSLFPAISRFSLQQGLTFVLFVGILSAGFFAVFVLPVVGPEKFQTAVQNATDLNRIAQSIEQVIPHGPAQPTNPIPTGSYCGDASCDEGESFDSCALDCFACNANNKCDVEIGENSNSCPVDCSAVPVNVCNNDNVCDLKETALNCPHDCKGSGGTGGGDGGGGSGGGTSSNPPVAPVSQSCGNNKVEGTEMCDGTALNSKTCITQGFIGGTLSCNSTCTAFITTACTGTTPQTCGNNIREGIENCDGTDLNAQTCISRGFSGGTLSCDLACTGFDTGQCIQAANTCTDGTDNDQDSQTDFADFDCFGPNGQESMTNLGYTLFTPSVDTNIIYVSSSQGNDSFNGRTPSTPVKTIAKGISLLRNGYPDWLLLKRGDMWVNESFGVWNKSGRSSNEKLVLAGYGQGSRPLVKTNLSTGLNAVDSVNNFALVGIELYADGRDPSVSGGDPIGNASGIRLAAGGSNLLFEDDVIRFYATNIIIQSPNSPLTKVIIRRNIITDAYSSVAHSQGLFLSNADDVLIEENTFDHDGWNENVSGAQPTKFNHDSYLLAIKNLTFQKNILARASSMGTKLASGADGDFTNGLLRDNFYTQDEIGIDLGGHVYDNASSAIGYMNMTVNNNVFVDMGRTVQGTNLANGIGAAGQNIAITNNYLVNTPFGYTNGAIVLSTSAAKDMTISDNTIYNWKGVSLSVAGSAINHSNVTIKNNIIQDPLNATILIYANPAPDPQISFSNNRYYSAASLNSWFYLNGQKNYSQWVSASGETGSENTNIEFSDPTRTVNAYDLSIGGPGSLDHLIGLARTQSRFNWRPEYTATAINNYIKAGFVVTGTATSTYTITASAATGGSISPSGEVPVAAGNSQTFAINPDSGFSLATLTVDGVTENPASSRTFSNVSANHTIAVTFAQVPSSGPDPSNLVAYYPFHGNANDASGNNNNGTLVNGATFNPAGTALQLNGVNSYVDIGTPSSLGVTNGSYTLSAWINPSPESNTYSHGIIKRGNSGDTASAQQYQFKLDARYRYILLAIGNDLNANQFITPNNSITLGEWNLVTFTIDDTTGTVKGYINGVNVTSGTKTFTGTSVNNHSYIGASQLNSPSFNGFIDDVRIYNRALSAADIQTLYAQGPSS